MKSTLLKSVAAVALAATSLAISPATSFAQSKDDAIQRLEARLDALAQENAALRDRVKEIETGRHAAPKTFSVRARPFDETTLPWAPS